MADFAKALARTVANEGGYVLHKVAGDPGGETFAGIARKRHPDWPGWNVVANGTDSAKRMAVAAFYKPFFWDVIHGDEIGMQPESEVIFDFAVNAGVQRAVKTAQVVLGVTVDGVMGPNTLHALNSNRVITGFLREYTLRRIRYYTELCNRRPEIKKFLLGWVNRALSYA